MKLKICKLCTLVSGSWLLIQIGITTGILISNNWTLLAGILMGGSVVGIAYQRSSLVWKWMVVLIGMPLAYIFLTHISPLVVAMEIVILLILASFLFVERGGGGLSERGREIEERLKNCC